MFVTGLRQNTNHLFGGVDDAPCAGFSLFILAMAMVVAAWLRVSPCAVRHARLVQRTGAIMIGWLQGLAEHRDVHSQLTQKDISPFFWPNGTMLASKEFDGRRTSSRATRLRISGLVEASNRFR